MVKGLPRKEKHMFSWETQKKPGLHPEYLKGRHAEGLALQDPIGLIYNQ